MKLKSMIRRGLVRSVGQARLDAGIEVVRAARYFAGTVFQPARRANLSLLSSFRDRHRGQRCLIIGNGPSLRNTNLSLLRNELTFGLNRIYLLFPTMGFQTTYHVTVNDHVVRQFKDDIVALKSFRFITERARPLVGDVPDTVFLRSIDTRRF